MQFTADVVTFTKQSLMENFIFAVPTLWSISPSKKVVIPITRLKKDNF